MKHFCLPQKKQSKSVQKQVCRRESFPHPLGGGLIPPTFAQHPTGLNRKEGERGRGEEKGREGTPKGWLTPPMFQILKNTLVCRRRYESRRSSKPKLH